jgi:hypothetical protein
MLTLGADWTRVKTLLACHTVPKIRSLHATAPMVFTLKRDTTFLHTFGNDKRSIEAKKLENQASASTTGN